MNKFIDENLNREEFGYLNPNSVSILLCQKKTADLRPDPKLHKSQ